MIDEKLARELYRPLASMPNEAQIAPIQKIPVHRFQALEQQINNSPASPQPYIELATIYIDENRWKDAKRVLEKGTLHNAENETILTMFEDVRLRLARNAMEATARKFRQFDTDANRRELDQSELELAALQFEISEARLQRNPQQAELLVTSAVALKRLARVDEAIERLQLAQSNPQCRAAASLHLGVCLESQNRVVEALASYRCAALYRSPAPPAEIRVRALELASALSEKHFLFDSAIRYLTMLSEDSNVNRDTYRAKIESLRPYAAEQKKPHLSTATDSD